jgi:hypothetical protein
MARIKLLRNKRDLQIKQLRKEIAQLLTSGQEPSAHIRVSVFTTSVPNLYKEGTLQTKSFVGFLSFVRLYVGAGGITLFHMQTCHIMLGLMMGFHVYQVEHIFREENILAAYDILELFCELITVRLPIIESQKYVVTLCTFIPESRR